MNTMQKTIVAIVGRPNVGKSTLFNRLIGKHTAITEDFPGVTRDRIYGTCQWLDKTFAVVDTSGFEPDTDDPMMASMQFQTRLAMEEADVIVCLFDVQVELTAADYELVNLLRQSTKPVYYVANKVDEPQHEANMLDLCRLGVAEFIPISAEHKTGLDQLLDKICEHVALFEDEVADESAIRIAVVGRPNVGKSSLVNYLLGEHRMLVTDIPGTTRDAIDSDLSVDGVRYVLIDTAGIRRKSKITDSLERYSVVRALRGIDRCHIAFMMLDPVEGVTDQDARIAGYAHEAGRAILLIVNKWDLVAKDSATAGTFVKEIKDKLKYLDYAPIIFVSALTGQRALKTLTMAHDLFAEYNKRVATSALNVALGEIVRKHNPPVYRGREVKFYYAAQTAVRPPTIVLFCNHPEGVHFSYQRYLTNQLREQLEFLTTPLHLRLQKR
jgi:GTP-binding protein